jgi:excisionase family DNA binding protein
MSEATPPAVSPQDGLVRDGFAEVAEAQAYLRLSRSTIYVLMDRGELPFARFGRARRIPWRSLRDYAAAQLVGVA